jgi:hypothetical protein
VFTERQEFLNLVAMNVMLRRVLAFCSSSLTAGLIKLTKLNLNPTCSSEYLNRKQAVILKQTDSVFVCVGCTPLFALHFSSIMSLGKNSNCNNRPVFEEQVLKY